MAKIGIPYSGNEVWAIQNNSQANGLQTFLSNFQDQATRSSVLNQSDYSDGLGGKKNVHAFISRDAVKALMADVVGSTPRTNVVGVGIHFGYDTASSQIVLIAHSDNGQLSRPSGAAFSNFNYLSKAPDDLLPNPAVTDSEVDTFMANFRANGHTFLSNLANGTALSVKFDNHVLARLLYSDIGPVSTITGQSEFHLVIAPLWEDETDSYLSLVGQGTDSANGIVYTGSPPCPRYCP